MSQISVIIPCYNTAAFLPRCLDSLLAQDFADWEAVCVDDGSTDGSAALLDAYAARDSRFRVIHQPNAGMSAARNVALATVRTPFLLFLDSDDFLHPQTMSLCHRLAERDGSDLVTYTYDHAYRSRSFVRQLLHLPELRKIRFRPYSEPETRLVDDLLQQATEYSHAGPGQDPRWLVKHCYVTHALFRTECVRDIPFLPLRVYEDFPWWGEVLRRVRKATILNLPLYFYCPNAHSIILHARQDVKVESLRTALRVAQEIFRDEAPERRTLWERNFLRPFQEKLARKERGLKKI